MDKIKLKFKGIDRFNRPVFKDIERNIYFGSVDTLFGGNDAIKDITNYFKKNINELEYFGISFDCEPHGGKPKTIKLEITL